MSDELRMVYNRIVSELDNVTRNRAMVTDTSSKEYILLTGRIQGLREAKEAIEEANP